MPPTVATLDHLVLTIADIAATCAFYRDVLGMRPERFTGADGAARWALVFGDQKINLHAAGHEIAPHAARPAPGSADLCFLTQAPISDWLAHLGNSDVTVELGPVPRTGATGPITSLYIRDPDGNLLEIAAPG
ncbi:VOC family protein [Roseovarius salinarum]|uniref:VOC family protein n=1 Tax=Roseovarius salinarum TaxID=1981892 RepID=UPI000C339411|nr:VOC family protein [Roseovarius salinarum]